MTSISRETRWVAWSSIAGGVATLGLAITALVFPEPTLIAGMLVVGALSVLFGLNNILTAASIRARAAQWHLLLAHGGLLLAYGLLTVGGTALSFAVTLASIAAWLVAHAALAVRVATKTSVRGSIRFALCGSALLDIGIAVLVVGIRPLTIFQFLYFGAAYAAIFGASQIVTGIFLRGARLDRVAYEPDAQSCAVGAPRMPSNIRAAENPGLSQHRADGRVFPGSAGR